MKFKLKKILSGFKEYIVLSILLLFSLVLIPQNNHPSVKKIKSYGFASIAVINSIFSSTASLFRDDAELTEQKKLNAELMLQLNMLREHALENESLKNLLNFSDTASYSLIPSKIISKLVSSTKGNMIINRGISDSIEVGMPVINEKGLLGIIVNLSDNFSQVRTINNSNLKITGKIQRLNTDGIISWDGRKLVMKNLPSTVDVRIGDRIVTSEFSTILPPAIPVGVVSNVNTVYLGSLINVDVQPFTDISSVNDVFVLKLVLSKQIDEFELNFYN